MERFQAALTALVTDVVDNPEGKSLSFAKAMLKIKEL